MSDMIHEFDPLIYPRKVWVAVGVPHSEIGAMFPDVYPLDESDEASVIHTRRLKPDVKAGVLIRFQNRKAATVATIAHESAHAAMEIFGYIGAKVDLENQEPFSYLCGWIAGCIDEVLKSKKKRNDRT